MTVRVIPPSVGDSYEGLSSDAKPTGVVINSTFREQDTGKIYITYDGTDWVLAPGQSALDYRMSEVLKPFGKGSLTTDGVQYSAEVSGIGDVYTAIEAVTITKPSGYTLEEIELALTVAIKSSSTVEGVNWKMQASDNGTDWQDLIAEQTRVADASAYADVSASGRFAPAGNFLGTGATFQVRAVAKSAVAAGETASGKMKNSSYIIAKYRRS